MSDRGALTQPGAYPERKHRRPSPVEKILRGLAYLPQSVLPRSSPASISARIRAARAASTDARAELQALRYELRKAGMHDEVVARALAQVARAASALGMKPDDLQVVAAWQLIHGQCVELQAVDARALACALAAAVVALSGATVHLIVPVAYVARRDCARMKPLFDALGLKSACVDETVAPEQRKESYSRNVVYCVQRELALDYLRDRLVLKGKPKAVRLRTELLTMQAPRSRNLMLRGLQFAIIDEADVVLVDSVQTPISISAEAETSQEVRWLGDALKLAQMLEDPKDCRIHEGKFIELTDAGAARLAHLAQPMAGIWQGAERREEIVKLALVAFRVLRKDEHYSVAGQALQADPQVLLMFGKQPSIVRLLRLLLELKEGCAPTATREMLARIAYQRFFTSYLKSAAIASDTGGIGPELWKVYRLRLTRLRPSLPSLWVSLPDRVAPDRNANAISVVARIAELRQSGSPVLLVTRSHAACGFWSEAMKKAGFEHQCLMGSQDDKEAAAFAEVATPGRITIAPHFVARGCSVARSAETEKLGGLRVIFVQLFPTRRHLRSLLRRSLPAGIPGSVQRMLALDDEILVNYAPDWWRRTRWVSARRLMMRYCQWRFDRDNRTARSELLRIEDYLGDLLAFSGGAE